MIETDFGWALAKMRDGYRVRRKAWATTQPDRYLYMNEAHSLIQTDMGGIQHNFPLPDVLEWDWEIVR